ncbi:MAG: ATP synthase F1 subunit delta [Ruminococcus sp.]|nr:ATP synthase F1 subunit delta [Ruminococcus sp.]
MNQMTESYAGALIELDVPYEDVKKTARYFQACPELCQVLESPVISPEEKDRVIEKLFPKSMHRFLRLVCQNHRAAELPEIFRDYRSQRRKNIRRIKATVEYVTPLTPAQQNRMVELIKKKTGFSDVELNLVKKPELLGGFILRAGDFRYDRSVVYLLERMGRKLRHEPMPEMTQTMETAPAQPLSRMNIHTMMATVEYVTPLTTAQQSRIKALVKKKTRYKDVELKLVHNPELLGGFILRAGNYRYDCSTRRKLAELHDQLTRR